MNPLLLRLAILVSLFAAMFLLSHVAVSTMLNRRAARGAINRRMQLLQSGLDREAVSDTLLKNAPRMLLSDSQLWEHAHVALSRMVMTSGIRMEVRAVLIGTAIAPLALFALLLTFAGLGHFRLTLGVVLIIAVMALVIGAGLPLMAINHLAQRRIRLIQSQFPTALDIFVRSLRAGHPVSAGIDLVTQELEDPIGSEFGMVADEVSYGADLTDALLGMAERWGIGDMRMLVVCVSVQAETGGNLAEILENLAGVIRERADMYLKVRALSSEGRMSGLMLSVLPILSFAVLFAVNPAFYLDVAQDPIFTIGFSCLLALYALGIFSIRKLVDLKV
jgi:tight adherence protein B